MPYTCAALILNHNGRELLPPLYQSLLTQRGLTAIVLIDNASTDDSIELTRRDFPSVEIIVNRENLDFGTAYNRAIETRSEDVILILNNDTIVLPDAVCHAVQYLETHPDVASVSFETLDHTSTLPPFPRTVPARHYIKLLLCPARVYEGPDSPAVVAPALLEGAACCVLREVFLQVRFDEDMDWYFEDADLAWSITRITGLKNVYLPSATFYHFESKSTRTRFAEKKILRMCRRNALIAFSKNANLGMIIYNLPWLLWHWLKMPFRIHFLTFIIKKRLQYQTRR